MLTKIEIENFKSIYKETIELGRVNVFIGENGCGKTNILEAVKHEIETKSDIPKSFKIFDLNSDILRGIGETSPEIPGTRGENLDLLIASLTKSELENLRNYSPFIDWLDTIILDKKGKLKQYKSEFCISNLYFRDKYMAKRNNIVSAENAGEGALRILFYLALFIGKKTPEFFAIENIQAALNPYLCRILIESLTNLAKKNDKQVLITTHQPAALDGLNLHDNDVRLFIVCRDFKGRTRVERKRLKPNVEVEGHRLKLSELWMRGHLGAIPQHF